MLAVGGISHVVVIPDTSGPRESGNLAQPLHCNNFTLSGVGQEIQD
jgi:hypothetical protein